ncbi:MAG: amino acid permease [Caulobacteraceae bacterium]
MTSGEVQRGLGPFLATMLVAGGMIGSGVYLLPASLGAIGSISILAWAAAIAGAALLAGVFSWLAILRPGTAGLFSYVREAFGPAAGFVAGAIYWTSCWVGNVAIALAVTGYLSVFLPAIAKPPASGMATVAILWLFVGANIVGPRFVARFGGWTLAIGLAPILLVAIGGWFYFRPEIFAASWNVSGQSFVQVVPASVVTVFWAFSGIENASVLATLVRNPARNVPIATLAGLAIAAVTYVLACGAIMGILPAAVLARSNAPFADAVAPLLGASVAAFVALCAMLKSCGTLGGAVLLTVETAESEAVLGQITRRAGARLADKASTAHLLFTGVLMSLAVVASASPSIARQFTIVIDVSVILTVVVYMAACFALWRIGGSARGPARMSARALAVGAALFCGWLIAAAEPRLLLWSAGLIAAASLAYMPVWLRVPKPAKA